MTSRAHKRLKSSAAPPLEVQPNQKAALPMEWDPDGWLERTTKRLDAALDGVEQHNRSLSASKAAAILAGARGGGTDVPDRPYTGTPFLKALSEARRGNPEAHDALKAVLGTSAATGQAIMPSNFVAGIAEYAGADNVYRQIMNFQSGFVGAGVDIPFDRDDIEPALLQGAFGSNKDVRDHGFLEQTATFYTLATIVDIGNQLLRQSNGAAEAHARRRLGKYFAKAEARFVTNGSGTNQPLGIFQAFTNTFVGAYSTALSSEPKIATIGRAIGVLESRGQRATAIVTSPSVFWSMVTETLGSNDEGGFAVLPGSTSATPQVTLWGVPIVRDVHWPAAQSGVALVGNFAEVEAYIGQEYRVDVSSEAGSRFDQNVTGFRAEMELGFNATPWYLTGHFQRVTGL